MVLENLMEEKQLNFNQPLLSVRRNSSTVPASRTENKKCDDSLPKIPPLPVYKSELKSGPVRNPGTVPFHWERSPGRPKDEARTQSQSVEQPVIAPRLPPGRTPNSKDQATIRHFKPAQPISQTVSSPTKNMVRFETAKDETEDVRNSGSEDEDDMYVDALDALSRSESFFLNCSISGVSGLDGPTFEPSGGVSMDPQTREFMMGRFLPAAKAIASETPPHVPRKQQPVVQEKPREIKKAVIKDKRFPSHQSDLTGDPQLEYKQGNRSEGREDEDEMDRYESTPSVACGLLPQLCLKSSFCLLSPVPGMKMPARKAISVRRIRSRYPPTQTFNENGIEQRKSASKAQRATDECGDSMDDHNNKPNGESKENQRLDVAFLQESQDKDPSSSSTDCHRTSKNFAEMLANEDNGCESGSGSPVVEKTVYIDAVCKVKSSDATSTSTDTIDFIGSEDHERGMRLESHPSAADSLCRDTKHPNVAADKKAVLEDPKSSEDGRTHAYDSKCNQSLIPDFVRSRSPEKAGTRMIELYTQDKTRSEVTDNKKIDLETELYVKTSYPRSSQGVYSKRPVPPPLPKAPTDSWLKRALLAKNATPWSPLTTHAKVQALKSSPSSAQTWETIVKTSNTHHERLRFSVEKLDAIPEA